MSYHEPYYYMWFSHGKCCRFKRGFPPRGEEYSIRVGRSRNVRGPFVDKDNNLLIDGGGSVIYASNHGKVYAPGGVGVLPGINASTSDILYFHYLNTSIGFTDQVCEPETWARMNEELTMLPGRPSGLALSQLYRRLAGCSPNGKQQQSGAVALPSPLVLLDDINEYVEFSRVS